MGALVLIVCALTFLDNWPQWRGPRGQGVSDEKNLPLEWTPTKNIKWKAAIPGRGHSSPIVWSNRVFLTTAIEGAVIPEPRPSNTSSTIKSSSFLTASSIFFASPVAFEGKILITSQDGDRFLITAGPKHQLVDQLVGEPVFASPAISGGRIFIRGKRNLYCIAK